MSSLRINHAKLDKLLEHATELLQKLFLKRWKDTQGKSWVDGDFSAKLFIQGPGEKVYKTMYKVQKDFVKKGIVREWDISILCAILEVVPFKKAKLKESLATIRVIRNDISHYSKKEISEEDFENKWDRLSKALILLGASENDLWEIKSKDPFNISEDESNNDQADKLKELGNEQFRNGLYGDAINTYSDAIVMPYVGKKKRAALYLNRAHSLLKMQSCDEETKENVLANALNDAEEASSLDPSWFKPHLRLGEIYMKIGDLKKSESCFIRACALEPANKHLKNALAEVKDELKKVSMKEHLDPRFHPKTTEERWEEFEKTLSISGIGPIPKGKLEEVKKFLYKNIPGQEDVVKGHEYRDGAVGVKQDYSSAAKYYMKGVGKGNAEAMYNMALLYQRGQGVEKNFQLAHSLLEDAATQSPTMTLMSQSVPRVGVAEAEHSLGFSYENGIFVEQSHYEAVCWYKKAVSHGSATAANNLGKCYLLGTGVKQDLKQAESFMLLAHKRSDYRAPYNLVILYKEMGDLDRALYWHEFCITRGDIESRSNDKEIRAEIENRRKWKSIMPSEVISPFIHQKLPTFDNSNNESYIYNPNILEDYVKKGGEYARKLSTAQQFFRRAMIMFENREREYFDIPMFVSTLAEGFRTAEIVSLVPRKYFPDIREILLTIIKEKRSSKTDEDSRIIYSSITGLNVEFLEESVQKYKKSIALVTMLGCAYSFRKDYEKALARFNLASELDPINYEVLYHKAATLRLHSKLSDARKYYLQFLHLAPKDHRKLPEAYYAIGNCFIFDTTNHKVKKRFP